MDREAEGLAEGTGAGGPARPPRLGAGGTMGVWEAGMGTAPGGFWLEAGGRGDGDRGLEPQHRE